MPSLSVTDVIKELTEELGINRAYLAGLLDVSERSLSNWESSRLVARLPPKGKRLSLLHKVLKEIRATNAGLNGTMLIYLLTNVSIRLEGDEVSLLTVINDDPETIYWKQVLKEAMEQIQGILKATRN